MEKLTLEKVSQFSNGRFGGGSSVQTEVCGVSTDSRNTRAGDLFVALKGDRFNGHDFLEQAARQGAVAAMVENDEMKTIRW